MDTTNNRLKTYVIYNHRFNKNNFNYTLKLCDSGSLDSPKLNLQTFVRDVYLAICNIQQHRIQVFNQLY